MADIKQKDEMAEVIRAVNTQAALLAEIVKACSHVVEAYKAITKVEVPKDEKKTESKVEEKPVS